MLKIKTTQNGKSFEAYVKMIISDKNNNLIGFGVASNLSTVRAIFGSLYSYTEEYVSFIDENTTENFRLKTTRSYKRLEELNGKVCHAFFLPRMAYEKEFNDDLQSAEQNEEAKPDRIIIGNADDIKYEVGLFLADAYGLPKTREWAEEYVDLLPSDKIEELNVRVTELMGNNLEQIKAYHIKSMHEKEVLSYIEDGIKSGILDPISEENNTAMFVLDMTTEEYLQVNALSLAGHIDQYMKPQYDGTHFLQSVGDTKRVSLPAQARCVMGALTVLKNEKSAFLVGDLGSGKTQMALTTAYGMMKERNKSGANDGISVLIVAPSIIVPKWANSEIPTILGNHVAKTTVLNCTEDAIRYAQKVKAGYKPKKGTIEFVLVSTDRMKLGANKYVLSARWNRHDETWHCPDCGEVIISPEATKEEPDMVASWKDAVKSPHKAPEEADYIGSKIMANGLPEHYVEKWSDKIRRFECRSCAITEIDNTEDDESMTKIIQRNNSLVRPALRSRGEDRVRPRWMIAQIFQRMLKNHFHLGIFDEIQQMKASNSGRGLSFHKLLKSTRKNLFLTATLTNGEATSIQSTLWRSDPKSLIDDGFSHLSSDIAWAKRYGVLEQVTTQKDSGVIGATTNRRNERVLLKTKPGISPRLTTKHLLHKSIFLDLGELNLPLVKKEEIPVIIPLKDKHKECYKKFESELFHNAQSLQKEIGQGAWARYNPATLNYADQPHIEQNINFTNREGDLLENVSSVKFPEEFKTAKEEALIDIVKKNISEGRGCIIYNHFTGQYKQNERLQEILLKEGIDSEILDTNVSSAKRFDWLERQKKLGTKVLIMNMSLVQVGLDLLEWSSIIYYQLNDDINTLRQAGGRNWRIGQNRNCRIYYLVNEETQQMRQFERLMSRRIEALLVEGRCSRSDDLVKFAKSTESKLARDLSFNLESTQLTDMWKSTAEKDVDQNIEMVDETELEARIKQAFKELTNETKKLCGVPDEPVQETLEQPNNNVVQLPLNDKGSIHNNNESVEIDLFNFEEFIVVDEVKKKRRKGKKAKDQNNEVIEQFAFKF